MPSINYVGMFSFPGQAYNRIAGMAETFEALLKVVVIGDTAVGKTCLILRYTQDLFRDNFLSTIGQWTGSNRESLRRFCNLGRGWFCCSTGLAVVRFVCSTQTDESPLDQRLVLVLGCFSYRSRSVLPRAHCRV